MKVDDLVTARCNDVRGVENTNVLYGDRGIVLGMGAIPIDSHPGSEASAIVLHLKSGKKLPYWAGAEKVHWKAM